MKAFERICYSLALLVVANACIEEKVEETVVNVQSAWQLRLIDASGIDDPNNVGVGRVIAHGEFLYLGTWNNESGGKMYRSRDGDSWELMGGGPFTGNKNDFVVVSIAGFKGDL